ncbi:hypothetical protein WJ50_12820 [Burkholderia ubonensis]|nr:hypothetical protein WJ49_22690 [Burkholderia ubonensis]KVL73188.1 hypothetical protein WJ48_00385 [Burkholderia ubonensis]KVL91015.1 hypothetical protein WJ50_12820 [Burkholderia ubonensis]
MRRRPDREGAMIDQMLYAVRERVVAWRRQTDLEVGEEDVIGQLLDAIDAALAAAVAGVEAEADEDGFTPLERMRGQLACVILFTRHDELRQLTQTQWRWLTDAGVLT